MPRAWPLFLLVATVLAAEPFRGTVEGPSADGLSLRVRGDDGAARVFRVGDGDLEIGWVGRPVRGEVVVSDGKERLERIFPEDPGRLTLIAATAAELRRDTVERGRLVARGIGDASPAFLLWDQDGLPVASADLRGRPVVLNFIFTRCKAADMCPASTASMVAFAAALRREGLADQVRLATMTFDPGHDAPGVLRAYARASGVDLARHRLLTGDRGMVRDLMRQFGIAVVEQDGTLVHNAATLVLSPEGRILARVPGARFESETVLPLVRRAIETR